MTTSNEASIAADLLRQLAIKRINEALAEASRPGADTKRWMSQADRLRRHAGLKWAEVATNIDSSPRSPS